MPKDVEIFVDWYADLVVRIHQLLKEKGISKKELAERLNKQPSEISKWLNGQHNFTLRSLAKLSAELGEPLLEVRGGSVRKEFVENGFICRMHTFVSYTKITPKSGLKEWQPLGGTTNHKEWNHAG